MRYLYKVKNWEGRIISKGEFRASNIGEILETINMVRDSFPTNEVGWERIYEAHEPRWF